MTGPHYFQTNISGHGTRSQVVSRIEGLRGGLDRRTQWLSFEYVPETYADEAKVQIFHGISGTSERSSVGMADFAEYAQVYQALASLGIILLQRKYNVDKEAARAKLQRLLTAATGGDT